MLDSVVAKLCGMRKKFRAIVHRVASQALFQSKSPLSCTEAIRNWLLPPGDSVDAGKRHQTPSQLSWLFQRAAALISGQTTMTSHVSRRNTWNFGAHARQ
jgi:hypothetical protein